MRNPLRRSPAGTRPPAPALAAAGVRPREVLAAASSTDVLWLVATRDRLLLVSVVGTEAELLRAEAWVDLDLADWDAEESRLVLVPSAAGEDSWSVDLVDAGSETSTLLAVVRDRLSATLVLERHAQIDGRRLTAVCRRQGPGGPLLWRVRYGPGADPDDPGVRRAAAALLAEAQREIGG